MATSDQLRRNVTSVRVTAVHDGVRSERPDTLATEEPMEIRAGGPGQEARAVAVTMRTPGADHELAVGFLFTEGLIAPEQVRRVAYCDDLEEEEQRYNVVTVTLDRPFDHDRLHRNFSRRRRAASAARRRSTTSRCAARRSRTDRRSRPSCSSRCPAGCVERQRVFDRTGGLHAAGLFTPEGELVTLREDVGRHNAVDKVIGEQVLGERRADSAITCCR